jgi:hypothetical protein
VTIEPWKVPFEKRVYPLSYTDVEFNYVLMQQFLTVALPSCGNGYNQCGNTAFLVSSSTCEWSTTILYHSEEPTSKTATKEVAPEKAEREKANL